MRAILKKLPGIKQALRLKDHLLLQLHKLDHHTAWLEAMMWNQAAIMQALGKSIESTRVVHATLEDHLKHTYAIETALRTHLQHLQSIEDTLAKARSYIQAPRLGLNTPEVGLMAHLYASLPSRCALDVGCGSGEVSQRLLNSGYLVYGFEPSPAVFAQLQTQLGDCRSFHSCNVAIGLDDGELDLGLPAPQGGDKTTDHILPGHEVIQSMPTDVSPNDKRAIRVRSLASLQRSKEIPAEIGLLKSHTGGFDLQVVRGMGKMRPTVIVTEFWDPEAMLSSSGIPNRLEDLVRELRGRDYHWYIVLYRIDGSCDISFYCNQRESISKSWGHVFFFHDYGIFAEALKWCTAALPRTYFRN